MSFADSIKELAKKAIAMQSDNYSADVAKTSLVLPYFQSLGYDIFNPKEFISGYGNANAKCDYAIIAGGITTAIIIVVPYGSNMDTEQLSELFTAYSPKTAIITNGVEYRYYADTDMPGSMDAKPFFIMNLADFSESDISTLSKFQKLEFDNTTAQKLKYKTLVRNYLMTQFDFADDDFIRFLLETVDHGKKYDSQFIDRIRPEIDSVLKQIVNDVIYSKLLTVPESKPAQTPAAAARYKGMQPISDIKKARALEIVKSIVGDMLPVEVINHENTQYYLTILCGKVKTHWICRLALDESNMYMVVHIKGPGARRHYIGTGLKYPLPTVESIYDHADVIKQAAKQYIE